MSYPYRQVLIAGIGWSTGDLILTRALPLWVGARGLQFDWQYIITSLEANVVMVCITLLGNSDHHDIVNYVIAISCFYYF